MSFPQRTKAQADVVKLFMYNVQLDTGFSTMSSNFQASSSYSDPCGLSWGSLAVDGKTGQILAEASLVVGPPAGQKVASVGQVAADSGVTPASAAAAAEQKACLHMQSLGG